MGGLMGAQNYEFLKPAGFEDISIINSSKLWSSIIRLSDGSLCIYSPIKGLKASIIESIRALGDVSYILAPNHYHNKGIADHLEFFPDAELVCSDGARPRLEKQTKLKLLGLDKLTKQLPSHIKILEPAGLKTGEIWFEVKQGNDLLWIVCDAFSSEPKKGDKFSGTLSMLKTFPKYGVENDEAYQAWVAGQIKTQAPDVIVPCHGPPVVSENLKELITNFLD